MKLGPVFISGCPAVPAGNGNGGRTKFDLTKKTCGTQGPGHPGPRFRMIPRDTSRVNHCKSELFAVEFYRNGTKVTRR